MTQQLTATTLLVAHQITIALGILLLPVALLARRAGVTIPIHRLVEGTGEAYEKTQDS